MLVSNFAMALVCVAVVAIILIATVAVVFVNYLKNDTSDSTN